MADVNGDQILDLVAGTGDGASPEVVAYSGAAADGGASFAQELTRFAPFAAGDNGGITVAGGDIDGNGLADNIIVGSPAGTDDQVKVFSSTLPATGGIAPDLFASLRALPG